MRATSRQACLRALQAFLESQACLRALEGQTFLRAMGSANLVNTYGIIACTPIGPVQQFADALRPSQHASLFEKLRGIYLGK